MSFNSIDSFASSRCLPNQRRATLAPRHCFREETLCFRSSHGAFLPRDIKCRPTTPAQASVDQPTGIKRRAPGATGIVEDHMEEQTDEIRRRVLIEASLLTHAEWTALLRSFYQRLMQHHPRLAAHFAKVNIDYQVQKLVVVLSQMSRDLPDRSALDRVLFHLGVLHVDRGISHSDFNEFIALLANVLAGKANLVDPHEAYAVWYHEISAVATTMLLTAS